MTTRLIKYGSTEYRNEVDLRQKILRTPLFLKFSPEELAREGDNLHLGCFEDGRLLGCLLLVPTASGQTIKMRQVAVDSEAQGLGVGKKLVEYSEELARERGFREMVLNARETAVPFYRKLGYEVFDESFTEVGLPHRKMRKQLFR